jgi:F-type H+-transporting ATPase subunit delta
VTNRTAATRYARALLDVAIKEKADLSQIEIDLAGFVALVDSTPALAKALLNPVVPAERKRATVEAIVARSPMVPIVGKTLALLADRDRFALLHDILDTYRDRMLDHQRVVRARITTASPIASEQAQQIEQSLARATGRTVVMTTDVDPSIIGGLVARVGGTVYDGSVTNHLHRLKQRLEESI